MGILYTKVNFLLASPVCMLYATVFTLLIPHITTTPVLLAVLVINQIAWGAIEAGGNMFIMNLWGKETTPFMQAYHFTFGVGSLIAPLIAVPFLVETDEADRVTGNLTTLNTPEVFHPEDIQLVWPYSILAAFLLANAVFGFVVWRLYPVTTPHPSRVPGPDVISRRFSTVVSRGSFSSFPNPVFKQAKDEMNSASSQMQILELEQDPTKRANYKRWKILTVILTLVFMHIYLGVEISFGSFLTTFAVKCKLQLSKADGAHLTTLFWSTFTLFRILTVFYIDYIGQEMTIFASLIVILISNIFLVPFSESNLAVLWIGVALIGAGISSIWACVFGFLEEHFTVTPLMSAFIIVAAVLGEFVFPVIISAFIDGYASILLWVTLSCSLGISILFVAISLICRFKLGKAKM